MYPMKNFRAFSFLAFLLFALTFTACETIYDDQEFGDAPLNEQNTSQEDHSNDATIDPDMGIAFYQIDGDFIIPVEQQKAKKRWMEDEEKHRAIWEMTTTLIPTDYRRWMTTFEIFDGENDILGYVNPTANDLSQWNFALDIRSAYPDGTTLETQGDYIHTIIHEYGHIMALNDEQLQADANSCSSYNPGEGCATQNSYLHEFYNRFWADLADEVAQIDEEDEDAIYEFYEKYEDRFVTDYAATNPVEDLAEVFAVFVTSDSRPSGNLIKDKKVQFLYEYPELIDLREHMRGTVYTLPEAGSWKRIKHRKHHHKSH